MYDINWNAYQYYLRAPSWQWMIMFRPILDVIVVVGLVGVKDESQLFVCVWLVWDVTWYGTVTSLVKSTWMGSVLIPLLCCTWGSSDTMEWKMDMYICTWARQSKRHVCSLYSHSTLIVSCVRLQFYFIITPQTYIVLSFFPFKKFVSAAVPYLS